MLFFPTRGTVEVFGCAFKMRSRVCWCVTSDSNMLHFFKKEYTDPFSGAQNPQAEKKKHQMLHIRVRNIRD